MPRICAICGQLGATTRDHIPPKSIFPRPLPNDLITVPACEICNNTASRYDEIFKVFISFRITEPNELTDRTARTIETNNRLFRRLQDECRELGLVDLQGNIEVVNVAQWDSDAHDRVIERVIRGLYFHHTGRPVPHNHEVKVQFLRSIPQQIQEDSNFQEGSVGNAQFKYKYIVDPYSGWSTWVFDFYGEHFASGYTRLPTRR